MNWEDIQLLYCISKFRTLTAASNALGMSVATVSRKLEKLTEDFGETLFVRRGNAWEPTEYVEPLLTAAEVFGNSVEDYRAGLESSDAHAINTHVSAPEQIFFDTLAPKLPEFLASSEGASIEYSNKSLSVALGEVDLSLGFDIPETGRLVRTSLGESTIRIYSNIRNINSLRGYAALQVSHAHATPYRDDLQEMFGQPILVTPCLHTLIDIANKMPVAVTLPTRFARQYSHLVEAIPEIDPCVYPIWAVYHESRRYDSSIRSVINFIRTHCI